MKELSSENSELKAKILELKEALQNVETENNQLMVSSHLDFMVMQTIPQYFRVFAMKYNKSSGNLVNSRKRILSKYLIKGSRPVVCSKTFPIFFL